MSGRECPAGQWPVPTPCYSAECATSTLPYWFVLASQSVDPAIHRKTGQPPESPTPVLVDDSRPAVLMTLSAETLRFIFVFYFLFLPLQHSVND